MKKIITWFLVECRLLQLVAGAVFGILILPLNVGLCLLFSLTRFLKKLGRSLARQADIAITGHLAVLFSLLAVGTASWAQLSPVYPLGAGPDGIVRSNGVPMVITNVITDIRTIIVTNDPTQVSRRQFLNTCCVQLGVTTNSTDSQIFTAWETALTNGANIIGYTNSAMKAGAMGAFYASWVANATMGQLPCCYTNVVTNTTSYWTAR